VAIQYFSFPTNLTINWNANILLPIGRKSFIIYSKNKSGKARPCFPKRWGKMLKLDNRYLKPNESSNLQCSNRSTQGIPKLDKSEVYIP